MPKFLADSIEYIPMSGATFNLSGGILVLPSGTSIPDVEIHTINGSSVALSGEVKFVSSSGALVIASGETGWLAISFV